MKQIVKTIAYATESPDRPNIKYSCVRVSTRDYDESIPLIVYCRSLTQSRKLYAYLDAEVHVHPKPFAKYHSETIPDIQKEVVASFAHEDGEIRILFSTIAFGMGVDVKGLHNIIHLGIPSDIEFFVQESGRAGRDGKLSCSILVTYPGMFKDSKANDGMKNFAKNSDVCRRQQILRHFSTTDDILDFESEKHNCCDICR
ncbi:putative ATP-dependent DNA helicase Q1 [Amphiura filiformis]|uniref:putative ATP-dependent DNA helicase Q1 n=1 Tax=Amphiura filiformis TaxID=82378 RepID=UPI003B228DEF